jgi:serine/threonine protein kinase
LLSNIQSFSRYEDDFDQSNFDYANKDAMVMERLTASPYVVDIFTTCGATQVIEYSEGGNIHDLIKIARLAGVDKMPSIDKLRICVQIVAAVADMHSFEKDSIPSLSHNDLCCHQFLLVDGVYKLNDFHLAKYMKKNKNTNEMCPTTIPGFNSNVSTIAAMMHWFVSLFSYCHRIHYSFTRHDHRKRWATGGGPSWIFHRWTHS